MMSLSSSTWTEATGMVEGTVKSGTGERHVREGDIAMSIN